MTPFVLLEVQTVGSHLTLILVHTGSLSKILDVDGGYGGSQDSSVLTDDWQSSERSWGIDCYCFTPHSVKWKWDVFCRHSLVRFRWKHNAAHESRTEVPALWEYQQQSFISSSFLNLEVWGACVFPSVSLSMLCVVPLYCLAVIQLCKPESVKAPPNKALNEWPPAAVLQS